MNIVECPLCEGEFELEEDFLLEDEDGEEYVWCPLCEEAVPLEEFFKEYWKYRQQQAAGQKAQRRATVGKVAAKLSQKLYGIKGKMHLSKQHKLSSMLRDPEKLKQYRKEQFAKGVAPEKLTRRSMVTGSNKEAADIRRKKAELYKKELEHSRAKTLGKEVMRRRSKEFWGGQKEKALGKVKGASEYLQKKKEALKGRLRNVVGGLAKRAEKYA